MYKKIIIFITGLLIVSTCPALAQEGCTCLSGCESVSDTSTNFEKNGKGDFCFRFDCIGGYINSWNMETVEINNVDITNKWVPAISLPEKIDGVYYVFCRGNNEWSHFEAIGGCGSTIESTPVPFVADIPAAVTVSSEGDGAVDISVFPPTQTVYTGDDVTVEIHIASETLKIAAYGINIGFDDLLLEIDTSMGVNGVQEGSDGFLSAVNIQKDGEIKTSGFDTAGKGPGSDLHLLTVYFKAIEEGISEIDINVIDLTDEHTQMIGFLPVTGGSVVILESGTDPQSTAPPTSPPVETVMPTIFSSDPPTPQPTLIGPSEDDYPAWRARFFYRRGDRVFYDGVNYECIAWWSYNQRPPYHPYIWKEAGKAVTNPPTPAPTDSPTFEPTSPPAMSEPPAATPAMEGCMCDSCCDTVIQISTDFTQDGPGEYCWFIPCVGSFINSWNLLTLSINGVDFTNSWKIPEELPPPVDGGYYIFYRGTYTWSHFEAKGICEGIPTDLPATPAPEVTDTVSEAPTSGSTPEPTAESTTEPTLAPTPVLTAVPTAEPTVEPTPIPTDEPTEAPTTVPTDEPTVEPTPVPTDEPTEAPSPVPTDEPTVEPTPVPTAEPTVEPTDLPTPLPTAVPTTPPVKSMGSVWIFPESQTVAIDTQFITEVRCHTGTTRIAAYGIDIYYNPQIVAIYRDIGNNGVQPGSDGFLSAINANESGKLVTSGFDTDGSGPGENLHILTVNWTAIAMGTTYIEINIRNLVNENTYTIGELQGIPGKVTVM